VAARRGKRKDRKVKGNFLLIGHHVVRGSEWASLTAHEVKLLIDVAAQFKGHNNGDLVATWSYMEQRGWRSRGTLCKALKGLRRKGWLILSRQGGRHRASLYAVSWYGIDECNRKLDVRPSPIPENSWRESKTVPLPAGALTREQGQSGDPESASRVSVPAPRVSQRY